MPEDMVSYEEISDSEIEENISDETIEEFEVKEENSFSEEQTTEEQENLIENVTMEDENISEETQVEETTVEEVPVTDEICVQAENKNADIVQSGKLGNYVTYTLDSSGLLTISGKGDMEDYDDDIDGLQQQVDANKSKIEEVEAAMKAGKFKETDLVTIGNDAWATGNPVFKGSSLMFLKPGERVSVADLTRGINLQSGNDACVALADYIAGGQPQFVAMMNNYVQKLNLRDTHFETVHGLDAPGQHSSAYDLAVLSRAIIHGEPDFYHMYSEKSLTWNGITQQNRNGLLWDKTMNVDGLKTGHTSGAGFNLIASAVDGQRRLIAVVMGAESAKGREDQARKLLQWGQQNFDTVQVLRSGKQVGIERIWYGDKEKISLGTEQDFWMALPKAEVANIKAKYVLDKKELVAPIAAHQRVGEIELYDRDKLVAHWPLVTLESVNEGGVFSRLSDYFHHKA